MMELDSHMTITDDALDLTADPTTGSGPLVPVPPPNTGHGNSPPPPRIDFLLVTSGGHQSTYSWQVGGTHPTGMLSCCIWGCSLEGASW